MTETTTIEVYKEHRDMIAELQEDGEANKHVIARLLESYTPNSELTEAEVRKLANEQIAERVIPEAQQ